jgi:hypothetical protein
MTKLTDSEDYAMTSPAQVAADLEQAKRDAGLLGTVRGYRVELEHMSDAADPKRGVWLDCWVTTPDGRHTNSLACLEGEGCFDDGPEISATALDLITAFAERAGY